MNRSWTFTAEVVSPGSQRTKPEFVSIKENGAGYFSTFKIAGNELNKNTVAPEPEKQYTEWIDQTKSVTQVKSKNEFDLTTSINYEPPGIQKPNKTTKKAQVRTRVLTIAELLN